MYSNYNVYIICMYAVSKIAVVYRKLSAGTIRKFHIQILQNIFLRGFEQDYFD